MKVVIAGTGYVGLSNAILLAQHNEVIAVDIVTEKVALINNKISPIADKEIEEYLQNKKLNLTATTNAEKAYSKADYIVISTPTNYDTDKNYFDMSSIETVLDIIAKVKNIWTKDMGKKAEDMKNIRIYLKPEEMTAYYVINEETTGKIAL